jgi:hypothetical protein
LPPSWNLVPSHDALGVRQHRRATLLVDVGEPADVEQAEAWLERVRYTLSFVSDQKGCGCCVLMWDVEGPTELLTTLPERLSCDSTWTRREDASGLPIGLPRRLLKRWQASSIYKGYTLPALLLVVAALILLPTIWRFISW